MFPYKADIKPVDISPQQWSETWISLEIKTAKPDWKLETQLSCKWITKKNKHKFQYESSLQLASNKYTQG